jgi:protein-S-isoprenylcysteine O-methyltransferase Ste14
MGRLLYAVFLAAGFHVRVLVHEEPWLSSQFGGEWARYCSEVGSLAAEA